MKEEPSAADRRIADVIRSKLACEGEMKMLYGDDEEYRRDQLNAAKIKAVAQSQQSIQATT